MLNSMVSSFGIVCSLVIQTGAYWFRCGMALLSLFVSSIGWLVIFRLS